MNSGNSPLTSLPLSSLTQAAVVIKSLPRWQAASLLSRIRAEECVKLLEAVSQIDQVTSTQLAESLQKLRQDSFKLRSAEPGAALDGPSMTPAVERRKQAGSFADRAYQPFDYLINTDPRIRAQLLENEHPRNIGLILSSLPAEVASTCLAELDPVTRVSVIRRMCEQEEIDSSELNELNYILKLRHQKLFRRSKQKSAGIKVAVELLSYTDATTQQSILSLLEQTEPELAQQLEFNSFTLDDLVEMSDQEIKSLLAKVDTSCWAPALKRAGFPLQQKVLNNMAVGPRKLLSQQMAELQDIDPVLEKQAHRKIIKEALNLGR
jgi:flagellar motor switch protein FliG